MKGTADQDAHGPRAAEGVGHAREIFPGVGFECVDLDLGIEGAVVEIDKVSNADELVVVGGGIVAEAVDAGCEEGGVRAVEAVSGENPVLADVRVPEGDVVGDVGDTDEAVAGTENLDAVAVAHERVSDFEGFLEGLKVDGVEVGAVTENEGGVGFAEVE